MRRYLVFGFSLLLWAGGLAQAAAVEYTGRSFRDPFSDPATDNTVTDNAVQMQKMIASYVVQGVLFDSEHPKAIVNGAIVQVGSQLKLGKIIWIGKEGVTVLYNQKELLLRPKGGAYAGSSKTVVRPRRVSNG